MGMVDNYVCAYEQELCRDMQTSCKSRCGMDAEKNTFERLDLLSLHSQGLQKPFFFNTVAATNDMTSFFSAYKKHIAHGKKHRVQNSFLNKRTMRVIIPGGPPRRILGAPGGEAQRGRSAQSDWVPSGGETSGWVDSAFFTSINNSYLLLTIVQ